MTVRFPVQLVKLFSTAVIDQILLSGASFFLGFLLIRHTSDFDYGLFVLAQSALTLLIAAQGAWTTSPVGVLAPKKSADQRRQMIGAIEGSQRRFLTFVALLLSPVPLIGWLAGFWSGVIALVAVCSIAAGWVSLQREYMRVILFVYSRPKAVLRADIVYVVVLMAGAVFAAFGPKPPSVWAVVALVIAGGAGAFVGYRTIAADPGWISGDARPYWREMRSFGIWAAVGALIYWLFSQSYNYVLAGRVGLTAVADINAARLLLMPTIVLTVGVKGLLNPLAAAWVVEFGVRKLIRRLLAFIVGIALLDIAYFAILWLFRDWFTLDFLHKTIHDRDRLLLLWAAVSLISLIRDLLQSTLLALERFKPMAWLTAAAAVVSLSLMWIGIEHWGAAAALIGQICGEMVNLAGIVFLLYRAQLHDSRIRECRVSAA